MGNVCSFVLEITEPEAQVNTMQWRCNDVKDDIIPQFQIVICIYGKFICALPSCTSSSYVNSEVDPYLPTGLLGLKFEPINHLMGGQHLGDVHRISFVCLKNPFSLFSCFTMFILNPPESSRLCWWQLWLGYMLHNRNCRLPE